MNHPDELALLQHVIGDLSPDDHDGITTHLSGCRECQAVLHELEALDADLRRLAAGDGLPDEERDFDPQDPFRHRPPARFKPVPPGTVDTAIVAAQEGRDVQEQILRALEGRDAEVSLEGVALQEPRDRYGLLYALREAGIRVAADPPRVHAFAQAAIRKAEAGPREDASPAEAMVPRQALVAQAQALAGQACLWTKDYALAGEHFRLAYEAFGASTGDYAALAYVELQEAQRRAFVHEPASALALAQRAQETFVQLGLDDASARAQVAVGLAQDGLGQHESAAKSYRKALPVFAELELWSNYVGAMNSLATTLTTLGRLDEARRAYARALRQLRPEHRSWQGYLQYGLARTLLHDGRYRDAADAAQRTIRTFQAAGMNANAHISQLLAIEAWARDGQSERARTQLALLRQDLAADRTLDIVVVDDIRAALAGEQPDFQQLAGLCERLTTLLQAHTA